MQERRIGPLVLVVVAIIVSQASLVGAADTFSNAIGYDIALADLPSPRPRPAPVPEV